MYWILQSRIRHPVWERLCRITHSGQTLYRRYHLPLSDTVNRVDVRHALDASGIVLKYAVDADEPGTPLGAGALPILILTILTGTVRFLRMRLARGGALMRTSSLKHHKKINCLDNG